MKQHKAYMYLLAAVFLLAVAIRLFIAFQSPHFSEDAYFNFRQVSEIRGNIIPSFFDSLSYSGRTHIFPPVYYYILSGFSLVLGTALTLKIIPNLLACTLVIITYFIVFELTKKRRIALFCAAAAAFIPIFFAGTVNSASILSFTLPLTLYLVYCFMRIKERKFLYRFLVAAFILSLTSAISFLLVFTLLIYLLLVKLEFKVQNRIELEVILFITFLTLWINILIYKKAFLFHSYSLIWQNIPVQILTSYFKQVDIVASVTGIGLITLVLGVFAVYRYMLKERDRRTYLLMAFAMAVAFLLWFRLITLETGLMFLGAILIPLMGQALALFFKYLEMTKISNYGWVLWIPWIVLLLLTAAMPSIAKASVEMTAAVDQQEVDALLWLQQNTPEDSTVLATVHEGDLITAIAARKNVADEDFILIRAPADILDDVEKMFTSILKSHAVELMDKYSVDYVYFSPRAKAEYGIEELKYAEKDCFELVYDKDIKIYRTMCELKADD